MVVGWLVPAAPQFHAGRVGRAGRWGTMGILCGIAAADFSSLTEKACSAALYPRVSSLDYFTALPVNVKLAAGGFGRGVANGSPLSGKNLSSILPEIVFAGGVNEIS